MSFLKKLSKDSSTKKIELSKDENGYIIQMIQGEVIDVGCEVTGENPVETIKGKKLRRTIPKNPKVFSYKYKFTDPTSGEIIKAYDDLVVVEIGEQIYDKGEMVPLIFSNKPNKETGNDFTVTRKIVFPEIINKKKKRIKIVKILYFVFLFITIFVCMCYSAGNQPVENNANVEINENIDE